MLIRSVRKDKNYLETSYLSHDRISYGIQIYAALVSEMKKHVGCFHSLGTWKQNNKMFSWVKPWFIHLVLTLNSSSSPTRPIC